MSEDLGQCPICFQNYPVLELLVHVENCGQEDLFDNDLALALKLQEEEEVKSSSKSMQSDEQLAKEIIEKEKKEQQKVQETVKCQSCEKLILLDNIYILDECGHRFCRNCLNRYVIDNVSVALTILCPLKDCKAELSVRDMKELLPSASSVSSKNPFVHKEGTGKSTERIMSELKHIMKSDPQKNGYSVEPINDNIYHWQLCLFNFDSTDLLAQDMKARNVKHILLHINFPKDYPFRPPYIRVIRPRFQYRTGHVTIGGSICMENLTNKGWSAANSIEAIIVSIRAQLIAGGARLDPTNRHDYTEQEAKEAFQRMVKIHNWE